jgi:hypothetical protein
MTRVGQQHEGRYPRRAGSTVREALLHRPDGASACVRATSTSYYEGGRTTTRRHTAVPPQGCLRLLLSVPRRVWEAAGIGSRRLQIVTYMIGRDLCVCVPFYSPALSDVPRDGDTEE